MQCVSDVSQEDERFEDFIAPPVKKPPRCASTAVVGLEESVEEIEMEKMKGKKGPKQRWGAPVYQGVCSQRVRQGRKQRGGTQPGHLRGVLELKSSCVAGFRRSWGWSKE